MYQVLNCLVTEHDWRLVILGGTICWLASAVAISLFHRARASQGRTRAIWIGLDAAIGGAVVGMGVAAMHYTGMMALELPARVVWSPGIVLASVVFGSVFAALALVVAVRRDDPRHTLAATA